MGTLIYEESPNGPLLNHIIDGEPVLANNWGFGVEDGRPYFDTGMATPSQHAHLELVAPGQIVIVTGRELFGREFTGTPLSANPPNRAGGREFTGTPLSANPPNRAGGREFTGTPLSANPPNRAGGREFTGTPLSANPPNRAGGREFTGTPLSANPPNRAGGREFTGTPLSANPPNRAGWLTPVPRKPPKRDGTGPYRRSY